MSNKVLIGLAIAWLAAVTAGCATSDDANANANINMNTSTTAASDTTSPGPDNSEITTSIDGNGMKTETRVFHNNPRVAKVVVTTRNGERTTMVYAPNGESRSLKEDVGDALTATGNAIADGAGWVGDKAASAADKTKEGAETAGEKTVAGAKTVGEKTAEGAKKTGKAIKKAVTP